MSGSTLSQQLEQSLKPLENGVRFHIFNLQTHSEPSKLYKNKKSTLRHHLILVTGTKTKTDSEQDQRQKFICGIETDEYETIQPNGEIEKTVYIGKVDTTGTPDFQGVVGRVIQAYIKSVSPCTVHVFARSQPQYLFHQSARNKDKKVLSDRNLLRWWYKLLTICIGQQEPTKEKQQTTTIKTTTEKKIGIIGSWWKRLKSSSNESNNTTSEILTATGTKKQQAWMSIPSVDDEQSGWFEIGQKATSLLWRYGYPYDPDAQADEVLPLFEDDAKSRLLRTFSKDKIHNNRKDDSEDKDSEQMTVKEFWATLGVTEECGHHLAGFFVVKLGGSNDKSVDNIEKHPYKEIEREKYTVLWNYFMELSFEDVDHNIESTIQFISKWKTMNLDEPLVIDTDGPTRSIVTTSPSSTSPSALVSTPKQVNVLSASSIKRRNPSSKGKEIINVLPTSSIKRHNAPSYEGRPANVLSSNLIRRKRTDNDDATEQSKKPRTS